MGENLMPDLRRAAPPEEVDRRQELYNKIDKAIETANLSADEEYAWRRFHGLPVPERLVARIDSSAEGIYDRKALRKAQEKISHILFARQELLHESLQEVTRLVNSTESNIDFNKIRPNQSALIEALVEIGFSAKEICAWLRFNDLEIPSAVVMATALDKTYKDEEAFVESATQKILALSPEASNNLDTLVGAYPISLRRKRANHRRPLKAKVDN